MLEYNTKTNHYFWNSLIILGASFMAIYVPLCMVISLDDHVYLKWIYWIVIIIFIIDLVLRIRKLNKKEERDWFKPTQKITTTNWLGIDIMSVIPFLSLTSLGMIQSLQLIKLFRVGQFLQNIRQVEIRHERILTIIFFVFWLVLGVHWISCGWIAIIGIDTSIGFASNYIRALYWSITTLTTVGYGDIVPHTNTEMFYSMFVQLLGIGAFGFLIAHVVSLLSKKDPIETKYIDNIEQLTTTLKRRSLPTNLQNRILDYYSYRRHQKMGYDESTFLATLPKGLQKDVALTLRREIIEAIPLFEDVGENFIYDVAMKLEFIVATPGDYLIKAGEVGNDMFLIVNGEVQVLNEDESRVLAVLSDGDYFGEVAMLTSAKRNATVKTTEICNLYRLKKKTFKKIIAKHPRVATKIRKKAVDRGLTYDELG